MKQTVKIAIDGPAGAGKSSVAKMLAKQLGYIYIDTGAMYRALTYKIIKNNLDLNDIPNIVKIAYNTNIFFDNSKGVENQRIICDGLDVTELIRSPEVSQKVSWVASIPEIRDIMVKKQQELGQINNVIMDGRDIGTVVLPEAKYKFFLTASLEERAKRRTKEMEGKGYIVNPANIINEIINRDKLDTERDVSPLRVAKDAIFIDTSNSSLQEVVNKILSIITEEENDAL
ncbi:MAG: CMP/dCMP kinase [Clostridia bacterium]|jgi:cytidylate kinase|nr:CMP/dCMP kinase [Clostridia bacterium]MDN5322889.1 CMP/dCMP kinase [Clostridia bacterium]